MEEYINKIEKFLREEALSWGMITLYLWIITCGVVFYFRYYAKSQVPKKLKPKGTFAHLIEKMQNVRSLLMESDSNVEEADELFTKIENESKKLVEIHGEDRHFTKIYNEINILFDKAYARLDAKKKDQKKMQRFMRDQANQPQSDDDEIM